MVKTFHHLEPTPPDKPPVAEPTGVKTFHHLAPQAAATSPAVSGGADIRTFHGVDAQIPPPLPVAAQPQVLFAARAVTAEQADAQWRQTVLTVLPECDCSDFELDDRELQRIRNLLAEIRFADPQFQSQYAAEVTELMHQLQDKLAKLVADKAVGQLHHAAGLILVAAKSVDVSALDPDSLSSKISDWWRGRDARRNKLQREFELASREIALQIRNAQRSLQSLKASLNEFAELFDRNEILFDQLTAHVVAAHLKLREMESQVLPAREADLKARNITDPFAWQELNALRDAGEQWQRKLNNLKLLRHTALLTLPQLRLSQRNLLAMVGRFDDISEIVIPTWKQQFITALALSETDDSRLYSDLAGLQAGLREQLEQLVP